MALLALTFPPDVGGILAYVGSLPEPPESDGAKAEQVSAAAKGGWDLWLAVERSEWTTVGAAARWDWDETSRNSETLRLLAAYMVEAMVAIHNGYQAATPFDKALSKAASRWRPD